MRVPLIEAFPGPATVVLRVLGSDRRHPLLRACAVVVATPAGRWAGQMAVPTPHAAALLAAWQLDTHAGTRAHPAWQRLEGGS